MGTTIRFAGAALSHEAGESVLQTLQRHGQPVAHSCRAGACQSCLLRCEEGTIPNAAQQGLKETMRQRRLVLACQFVPEASDAVVDLSPPGDAAPVVETVVRSVERLGPRVARLRLEPEAAFEFRAGQFLHVLGGPQVVRSYSLARPMSDDRQLEIHVARHEAGALSPYLVDELRPDARLSVRGPLGDSFYVEGRPDQPLVLVGTGTGMAPLYGVLQEAIVAGHRGPIVLYHGSSSVEGLYLTRELRALAGTFANVRFVPCVSRGDAPEGFVSGRACDAMHRDFPTLEGVRVFLAGTPDMVNATRRAAYLAGASLSDIHADPFVYG